MVTKSFMEIKYAVTLIACASVFLLPLAVSAQGSLDLSATIRGAITSDPRSADMSEAEIDAMVAALADEANGQGINSKDILWRPVSSEEFTASSGIVCGSLLCKMNMAFGMDGSNTLIPIILGVTAAVLLFVIGSLLHHRGHHPVIGNLQSGAH